MIHRALPPGFTLIELALAIAIVGMLSEARYGARGAYCSQIVSGSVSCSNDVFGDPIGGVVKECLFECFFPANRAEREQETP